MWIWDVSRSNGGTLSSIIAPGPTHGIGTLIIKSGDGTGIWSQFNPSLVTTLHARGPEGLRVAVRVRQPPDDARRRSGRPRSRTAPTAW